MVDRRAEHDLSNLIYMANCYTYWNTCHSKAFEFSAVHQFSGVVQAIRAKLVTLLIGEWPILPNRPVTGSVDVRDGGYFQNVPPPWSAGYGGTRLQPAGVFDNMGGVIIHSQVGNTYPSNHVEAQAWTSTGALMFLADVFWWGHLLSLRWKLVMRQISLSNHYHHSANQCTRNDCIRIFSHMHLYLSWVTCLTVFIFVSHTTIIYIFLLRNIKLHTRVRSY